MNPENTDHIAVFQALYAALDRHPGVEHTLHWNPGPGKTGVRCSGDGNELVEGTKVRPLPVEHLLIGEIITSPASRHEAPYPAEILIPFTSKNVVNTAQTISADVAAMLAQALRTLSDIGLGELTYTRRDPYEQVINHVAPGGIRKETVLMARHATWTVWRPKEKNRETSSALRLRWQYPDGATTTASGRFNPATEARSRQRFQNFADTQAQPEHPQMADLTRTMTAYLESVTNRLRPAFASAALRRGPYRTGTVHNGVSVKPSITEPERNSVQETPLTTLSLRGAQDGLLLGSAAGTVALPAELCLMVQEAWPAWNALINETAEQNRLARSGESEDQSTPFSPAREVSAVWYAVAARPNGHEWSVMCRPAAGELLCQYRPAGTTRRPLNSPPG